MIQCLQCPRKQAFPVLVHADSKEHISELCSSPMPWLLTVYLPSTVDYMNNDITCHHMEVFYLNKIMRKCSLITVTMHPTKLRDVSTMCIPLDALENNASHRQWSEKVHHLSRTYRLQSQISYWPYQNNYREAKVETINKP